MGNVYWFSRFNPHGPYNRYMRQVRHNRSDAGFAAHSVMSGGSWRSERISLGGSVVHQSINLRRWQPFGLACLLAAMSSISYADEPAANTPNTGDAFLSMDSWQEPITFAARTAQATNMDAQPHMSVVPMEEGVVGITPEAAGLESISPNGYCDSDGNILFDSGNGNVLLDGGRTTDGGRPDDWSWGCGGSPYRNGPGYCDNWKVGCRWETYVDGMVMFREQADLNALQAATQGGLPDPEVFENFDHAVGGRISFIGYMPRWANYNVQAAYEGAEAWNASIVYPKVTDMDGAFEQRTLFYRTNLHSAELNIVRTCHPVWRPYCGVRFVKLDDEIRDFTNQEVPQPPPALISLTDTEVDTLNLFDIENNLIGFQVGVRRDLWRIGRMFSLQGYANAGVYHNKIKRSNIMTQETLTLVGDDTDATGDQTGVLSSLVSNHDVSDLTEISYLAEASVTGICRLNRCVAMRAGYQIMWLNNVHLAEDEYLMPVGEDLTRGLVFQGWHAGIEYRR